MEAASKYQSARYEVALNNKCRKLNALDQFCRCSEDNVSRHSFEREMLPLQLLKCTGLPKIAKFGRCVVFVVYPGALATVEDKFNFFAAVTTTLFNTAGKFWDIANCLD
jgi:hypothetical protein